MTFEEFKIALAAEVTNMVGEEVNVTLHKVQKNNGVILEAISVMEVGNHVSPTIYLDDLYDSLRDGTALYDLAKWVIKISLEEHHMSVPKDFFMDFHKIKDRICFRLVNYEKNKRLLKDVPHEKVMNLAKIYYYWVDPDIVKNAMVLIRKVDLVRWGVLEKELKHYAEKNTPVLQKWKMIGMSELIEDLLKDANVSELYNLEESESVRLYVLTNEEQYYGASCMLYPHVLEEISKRLNNHFYILPSSIHECIIMPDSGFYSQETLSQMVAEINEEHLNELEVLADCAYFYDKNAKAIIV